MTGDLEDDNWNDECIKRWLVNVSSWIQQQVSYAYVDETATRYRLLSSLSFPLQACNTVPESRIIAYASEEPFGESCNLSCCVPRDATIRNLFS